MRKDRKQNFSLLFICVAAMILTACSGGSIENIETMLEADVSIDEEIYVKPDRPNGNSGIDTQEKPDPTADWQDHIFCSQEIFLGREVTLDLVHTVKLLCDRIYLVGTDLSEEEDLCYLVSVDKKGLDLWTVPLNMVTGLEPGQKPENTQFEIVDLVSDGTYLYLGVVEEYQIRAGEDDPQRGEIYTLIAMDLHGNELWRQEVKRRQGTAAGWRSDIGPMVGLVDGVGCITVGDSGSYYRFFDSAGEKINEFSMDGIIAQQIFADPSGNLYLQYRNRGDADSKYGMLSHQNHRLSTEIAVPQAVHQYAYICPNVYGGSFDLYARDDNAIYGFYIGDTEMREILDFIDSGLEFTRINYLLILDDTEMIIGGYHDVEGIKTFRLHRLTKKTEKITITVAGIHNDPAIRDAAIRFNQSNDLYRVEILDYEKYKANGNWGGASKQLKQDILEGNGPDIIQLTDTLPVASYIHKGLLLDMYPYMDADPEICREDFLPNILEAYTVDGALYHLPAVFDVNTIVGKAAYVGEDLSWTLDELTALADSMPSGTRLFRDGTVRDSMPYWIRLLSGDRFLDWKTGKCRFDSEEFVELLEFSMRLPESPEDPNAFASATQYRADEILLMWQQQMYDFDAYQNLKYGMYGEDITLAGLPLEEGIGSTISGQEALGISSSCEHPEGAWAFIRYFLGEEYKSTITGDSGFPIRVEQLEARRQAAMTEEYWAERETVWNLDGEEVVIPVMSEEDTGEFMELLTSVDQVGFYDNELNRLIDEELRPFFAGEKTAEEAAAALQARAMAFIEENW